MSKNKRLKADKIGLFFGPVLGTLILGMSCGETKPPVEMPLADAGTQEPPAPEELIPLPRAFLDRAYTENKGLLVGVQADGAPFRFGDETDSLIVEARRFYDTLGAPGDPLFDVDYSDPFVAQPSIQEWTQRKTVPTTFEAWKTAFGFSPRGADETLEEWRVRTDTVVYYNKNELGLGREIGCAEFSDGPGLTGVACFVTNYGVAFNDQHNSLLATVHGDHPKNTVCISYRPSFEEEYQVQFYVYGPSGNRQEWAQLDTFGPRPVPHICMNCHGGTYDMSKHLAKNARFLPMDPNVLVFPEEGPGVPRSATRAGQEEAMRKINVASMASPLTDLQREYFNALYDNKLNTPGQTALTSYVPPGWSATAEDRDFFTKVVQPHCGTCHLADQFDKDGVEQKFYKAYASKDTFVAQMMLTEVCGMLSMPNAQPTQRSFWKHRDEPITIGSKSYPSMADAFITTFGKTMASCNEDLEMFANCRAYPDPDALCGNAVSGTACDRATGKCVPRLADEAPSSTSEGTGFCRADKTRGCVPGQECRVVASARPEGYDGICITCGRLDFPSCQDGRAPCDDGLVDRGGLCAK